MPNAPFVRLPAVFARLPVPADACEGGGDGGGDAADRGAGEARAGRQ